MYENEYPDESLFGEKDQMIAHFQEVTSLEDIAECLEILELANWDLDAAIQTYLTSNESLNIRGTQLPVGVDETSAASNTQASNSRNFSIDNLINPERAKGSMQNFQKPDTFEPRRFVDLEVEYKNTKKTFGLSDTETISTLKKLCEKQFDVPYANQTIRGWPNKDIHVNDSVRLKELYLPSKTTLYLLNNSHKKHVEPNVGKLSGPNHTYTVD
jgi:hypothetical protein